MERDEIESVAEGKVKLAIAELKSEILPTLAKIEERIIGIDGNGTGRMGAIQILEGKCDSIAGDVGLLLARGSEIKGALSERQRDKDGRWWRQPLWTGLVAGFAGAFFAALFGYFSLRGH